MGLVGLVTFKEEQKNIPQSRKNYSPTPKSIEFMSHKFISCSPPPPKKSFVSSYVCAVKDSLRLTPGGVAFTCCYNTSGLPCHFFATGSSRCSAHACMCVHKVSIHSVRALSAEPLRVLVRGRRSDDKRCVSSLHLQGKNVVAVMLRRRKGIHP